MCPPVEERLGYRWYYQNENCSTLFFLFFFEKHISYCETISLECYELYKSIRIFITSSVFIKFTFIFGQSFHEFQKIRNVYRIRILPLIKKFSLFWSFNLFISRLCGLLRLIRRYIFFVFLWKIKLPFECFRNCSLRVFWLHCLSLQIISS